MSNIDTRETDEAFIRSALDGNIDDLSGIVLSELAASATSRPDDIENDPSRLLDWTKRRLISKGRREEAKELVAAVKRVRSR